MSTIRSTQIDFGKQVSVGGKTGSTRVEMNGENYQYKPPISKNSLKRKLKSDFADNENFGEVLAARIARKFDKERDRPRVPQVDFVTDSKSPNLAIASKYLKGDKISSLDDYFQENRPKGKHVKLVSGQDNNPEKLQFGIDRNPDFKNELAQAIALSALVGDHDVNPGNMMVMQDGRGVRIGRIDYGHAFKDLMRFPIAGGRKFHDNNIIDFFNRPTVDGGQAKLWRDYPGLIPSKEMAQALKDLSNSEGGLLRLKMQLEKLKKRSMRFLELTIIWIDNK
ncbi:hypothetical protein EP47_05125 [Legionella norrlandica]|uniref:LepB N-terminal domain-containing protein n=1 Tax=Legionella norrlandica TaxID=1498499 RepID=A0A0A2SSL6_9GAMM|nr:hypothetical protein [Legionella norrlandica]KGP63747.1 hypothetical protein EP47_05125 [Legionella norrlandica]